MEIYSCGGTTFIYFLHNICKFNPTCILFVVSRPTFRLKEMCDIQQESSTHLLSLSAAPPSMTVLTKMPSFSRPASAPTPIPMILIPRPSSSGSTKTPQISSVILCIFISVQRSSQSNPKWLLLTMSTILWNTTEYVNKFSINWKNKETSTSKTWNNFYKNVKNGGEMPFIHPCPVLIIQMLLVLHNRE